MSDRPSPVTRRAVLTGVAGAAGATLLVRRAEATIRVSPDAMSLIDRLGAAAADAVRAAEPDADGRRTATIPIEGIGYAAGMLLGLSDGVEVLAPSALRRELALRADRVAALYRADDAER